MNSIDDILRSIIVKPSGFDYFSCTESWKSLELAFYDTLVLDGGGEDAINLYIETDDIYLVDEEGDFIVDEEGNFITAE